MAHPTRIVAVGVLAVATAAAVGWLVNDATPALSPNARALSLLDGRDGTVRTFFSDTPPPALRQPQVAPRAIRRSASTRPRSSRSPDSQTPEPEAPPVPASDGVAVPSPK